MYDYLMRFVVLSTTCPSERNHIYFTLLSLFQCSCQSKQTQLEEERAKHMKSNFLLSISLSFIHTQALQSFILEYAMNITFILLVATGIGYIQMDEMKWEIRVKSKSWMASTNTSIQPSVCLSMHIHSINKCPFKYLAEHTKKMKWIGSTHHFCFFFFFCCFSLIHAHVS